MMIIEKMKFGAVAVCVGALLSFSSSVLATTYVRTFQNGSFRGSMNYDGKSVSVQEAMTAPLNSQGPLGSFSSAVAQYYTSLQTDLGTMVTQKTTGSSFTAYPGLLSGPLTLAVSSGSFSGYPAGTLKASASGPSYSFSAGGTLSSWGVSATCNAYVDFHSVAFNFYYNPMTGVVIGAEPAALNPTQSVSCTTSFDWIPILGDFADDLASWVASKEAGSYISKWGSQVASQQIGKRFFGIETYIRPGAYVIGGFDVGAYIVNNLTAIFQTSGTVSMTLGGPITNANYQDNGFSATLNANAFKLGFKNAGHSYNFSLDETANYSEHILCTTGPTCTKPK